MNYVFLPQDRLPFASPSTLIMWPVFPVYGKSLNERIEKDKYMMVCLKYIIYWSASVGNMVSK